MYADIALDIVNHLNNDTVTFSGHDSRPRELPIDGHHALRMTQPCDVGHLDLGKAMYSRIKVIRMYICYILACMSGSSKLDYFGKE